MEFDDAPATFIGEMPFTVQGNRLVGDHTFVVTRFQITLTKLSMTELLDNQVDHPAAVSGMFSMRLAML